MHWLDFPPPLKNRRPSFIDLASARQWLTEQPQADPVMMQSLLLGEIEALDASELPPTELLPLIDFLRSTAIPVQEVLEPRFLRKPLPMTPPDQKAFETSRQLWTRLGIAYLRIAPHFAPADRLHPLHRAASALRLAEFCHLQAAKECPVLLDRLLFTTLAQAEQIGLQREPVPDNDFRHLGASNIAGHVAWAFLLRLIEPYALSVHQMAVANRALSRWRELAGFQAMPDNDPKAQAVPLNTLFGGTIPEGLPRWLDIRAIDRKLRHRLESLQAGESPESLKLGQELSSAACIRLLQEMRRCLNQRTATPATEVGEIKLSFGAENAYALFAGKSLIPQGLDGKSAALAHERVALFGFDRASQMPNAVRNLAVPSETWTLVDGLAVRPSEAGDRRISPCLIARARMQEPRLGVMLGLHSTTDGALRAQLSWYPKQVSAGFIERQVSVNKLARIPVFILNSGGKVYLIAPASAGIKLDTGLTVEAATHTHLTPTEVAERGADFVRYLCHSA
jgi:hypothetical protein